MIISAILLQALSSGALPQILLFGAVGIVFYFFMIRPQQKKQKDQKNFLSEIKSGDKVVTIGGLHGKVTNVSDLTFELQVDKTTTVTIERAAVSLDSTKRVQGGDKK